MAKLVITAFLICLSWITESAPTSTYYLNVESIKGEPNPNLLIVTWNNGKINCEFVYNPLKMTQVLQNMDKAAVIQRVSELELSEASKQCGEYGLANSLPPILWPGCLWCGPGTEAKHYDDLGEERETDMCCRDHDHCKDIIDEGKSKYNLTNVSQYTRLLCDCDRTFYDCLKKVNSETSNSVGGMFFNFIQVVCYEENHPIIKCTNRPKLGNCNEYELDMSKPKIWQFFENRRY